MLVSILVIIILPLFLFNFVNIKDLLCHNLVVNRLPLYFYDLYFIGNYLCSCRKKTFCGVFIKTGVALKELGSLTLVVLDKIGIFTK